MLFPQRFHAGLADGSVTLAFRRWRRPSVKAGGRQRTPGGELAISAVDGVAIDEIGDGAATARRVAADTMSEVRARMGLGRPA